MHYIGTCFISHLSLNMKLLLCFTLGFLTILGTSAKTINIQIDPEDILKLVYGVMNSETFRNFASQIVQRDVAKRVGFNNPYHPEDELVNSFDAANTPSEKEKIQENPKQSHNSNIDSLDKDNDNFLSENEVASEVDTLTDNDIKIPILKKIVNNTDLISDITEEQNDNKSKDNTVEKKKDDFDYQQVLSRKDGVQEFTDDRANFKPVQTRFVLKNSNNQQD